MVNNKYVGASKVNFGMKNSYGVGSTLPFSVSNGFFSYRNSANRSDKDVDAPLMTPENSNNIHSKDVSAQKRVLDIFPHSTFTFFSTQLTNNVKIEVSDNPDVAYSWNNNFPVIDVVVLDGRGFINNSPVLDSYTLQSQKELLRAAETFAVVRGATQILINEDYSMFGDSVRGQFGYKNDFRRISNSYLKKIK